MLVVVWAGGCSSPSGTPGDLSPTGKQRLAEYCTKRQTCAVEQNFPEQATCPTSTCLASVLQEAPLLEFFDCQTPKQCPSFFNDDDCFWAAGTADAEQTAFVSRCVAKGEECANASFGEACATYGMPIIRKEWLHKIDACVGMACADVDACIAALQLPDCW